VDYNLNFDMRAYFLYILEYRNGESEERLGLSMQGLCARGSCSWRHSGGDLCIVCSISDVDIFFTVALLKTHALLSSGDHFWTSEHGNGKLAAGAMVRGFCLERRYAGEV